MNCPKCSGKTKRKTGKVYGQPQMKTSFDKCENCGLEQNHKSEGIRVFSEVELANQDKVKVDAASIKRGS